MQTIELNMDGLVGPTHHYAGLSAGNIASTSNARRASNPKAAALQGLAKMRFLHGLGFKQALLPPHERPNLNLLRQCGFSGSDLQILESAHRQAPEILSASFSASYMWTANAATICPSKDSADHKVHFTPANLVANLHRHQEADFTAILLKKIFANPEFFHHHPVLPRSTVMGDEGAANHSRLCNRHASQGVHLFVYGQSGYGHQQQDGPKRYPARQTLQASRSVARQHQLSANKTVFACQNPRAIDYGVFHNDVIAVANESVLLIHDEALFNQKNILAELQNKCDFPLHIIHVSNEQMSISDCVQSYLFNSQILSLPDSQSMVLLAPSECEEKIAVRTVIDALIADPLNPVNQVHYMDLKQSMQNGGGPACLRLRVVLNNQELSAMHPGIVLNEQGFDKVEQWIQKHYRDRLHADDLIDPTLIQESLCALDELSQLLELGSIYPFQQA